MGDRYFLSHLKCPYCGNEQEDVSYAESCGQIEHICENKKCGKISKIILDFQLVKKKK